MLNTQQPTAKSSVAFTISGLVENTKYKVYSNLVDVDGKEIGESLVITAKAPNGNLQMTLDSTATVE